VKKIKHELLISNIKNIYFRLVCAYGLSICDIFIFIIMVLELILKLYLSLLYLNMTIIEEYKIFQNLNIDKSNTNLFIDILKRCKF
jgi:hypothetical protein